MNRNVDPLRESADHGGLHLLAEVVTNHISMEIARMEEELETLERTYNQSMPNAYNHKLYVSSASSRDWSSDSANTVPAPSRETPTNSPPVPVPVEYYPLPAPRCSHQSQYPGGARSQRPTPAPRIRTPPPRPAPRRMSSVSSSGSVVSIVQGEPNHSESSSISLARPPPVVSNDVINSTCMPVTVPESVPGHQISKPPVVAPMELHPQLEAPISMDSIKQILKDSISEQLGPTQKRMDDLKRLFHDTPPAAQSYLNPFAPEFRHGRPNAFSTPAYDASLSVARELKKPTPFIEKFSGDPLKYVQFIRQFNARICANTDSAEERMNYLLQFTEGEAHRIVQGYSHLDAAAGLDAAFLELQRRYGEQDIVARRYTKKALNWPSIKPDDPAGLDAFGIFLRECQFAINEVDALKTLEYSETLSKLVAKLPYRLHDRWRSIACDTKDRGYTVRFSQLVDFVTREARKVNDPVYGSRALQGTKLTTTKSDRPVPKPRTHVPTRSLMNTTASTDTTTGHCNVRKCPICSEEHLVSQCKMFRDKSLNARFQSVKDHRLCMNCLRPFHQVKDCQSTVRCREDGCGGNHHTLLHRKPADRIQNSNPNTKDKNSPREKAVNHTSCDNGSHGGKTYFQLVPVYACSNGRSIPTVVLLDSASQLTIIQESLAKNLGLKGQEDTLTINTMNSSAVVKSRRVSLKLRSRDQAWEEPLYLAGAHSLSIQTFRCTQQDLDPTWTHCQDLGIPESICPSEVGILIGMDHPEAHLQLDVRRGPADQPLAVRTTLGWSLMGKDNHTNDNEAEACVNLTTLEDCSLSAKVERFWKTESFGTTHSFNRPTSSEDRKAIEQLEKTTKLVNGHYEVGMLWRNSDTVLPNNRCQALRRYEALQRKIFKDQNLGKLYADTLNSYVEKGYARKLSPEEAATTSARTWYLPHHGVTNPNKPGKVRVVFDAAASYQGTSLNDALMSGPDLLNSLFGVLQRFRLYEVAIVGDVEAMFHQVRVNPTDADSLRFLWKQDPTQPGPPDTYQMLVHIFGATDSPACANFALQQTARDNAGAFSKQATEAIQRDFYMDDLAKSTEPESYPGPTHLVKEIVELASKGGFRVCKVLSNDRTLLDAVDPDARLVDFDDKDIPIQRTLGMRWDILDDTLVFTHKPKESPLTKRGVVSVVCSIFDPCGYITPFTVRAKILIQAIWKTGIDWDSPLPDDLVAKWNTWLMELPDLRAFRLPRHHQVFASEMDLVELHLFSDSSEAGFGAAAYLRYKTREGAIVSSFLASKTRVAPLKTLSMPRLELQGAVLATRLATLLEEELDLEFTKKVFWCDSKVVLQYIKNKVRRFKPFVANRVAEILDRTSSDDWRYIPTDLNPADLCTRGMRAADLKPNSHWYLGPTFLTTSEADWPDVCTSEIEDLSPHDSELRKDSLPVAVNNMTVRNTPASALVFADVTAEINPKNFSSWNRLLRSTAWLQRAICNFASRAEHTNIIARQNNISVEELEQATLHWVRAAQQDRFAAEIAAMEKGEPIGPKSPLANLSPFYDEDNRCLRVGGRLRHAKIPEEAKFQMLLPADHVVTRLLVADAHRRLAHCGQEHVIAEVRQKFWPIRARNAAKRAVSECLLCRLKKISPVIPRMADLPSCRLDASRGPFYHCGVDYFGPMLVKVLRTTQKRWGCLFTCLSTRAIHLELAGSLDTDDFLLCLRRFIGRRGHPREMYSDNGGNFKAADLELKRCLQSLDQNRIEGHLTPQGISWHFNPPSAPHFGGAWERLVKSVKTTLNALLKKTPVQEPVLHTALVEVEGVINSRPITPNSPDPLDYTALTPNHFLLGRADNKVPPDAFQDREINSRRRWRQTQVLADRVHKRWLREYLPKLTLRHRWHHDGRPITAGDMVLIIDEDLPRGQWELGRVSATYPGDDGRIRAVDVRTSRNVFRRPVSKLCVLEEHQD